MRRRSFLAAAASLFFGSMLPGKSASIRYCGVVYGARSRIIRRIIVPEDSWYLLQARKSLLPGELLALFEMPHSLDRDEVQAAIGMPAHSGRCCRIRHGRVIGVLMADPEIDPMIGGDLIVQSDNAHHGWLWDGKKLKAPPE